MTGRSGVGIGVEVIHHPVFRLHFPTRAHGVRPYRMGAVGAAVGHEAEARVVSSRFDVHRGQVHAGCGRGAGLVDHQGGKRLGVVHEHRRGPDVAVKHPVLGNGDSIVHIIQNRRVKALLQHPVPSGPCP